MLDFLLALLSMSNAVWCDKSGMRPADQNDVGCQHRSTSGRDYRGKANTTVTGIPCQKWSDSQPHDHEFTHVGDHNFCRNPEGSPSTQLWCYTTDPNIKEANCSVPFCPPLKVLDFSLDNDWRPDPNGSYTHASYQKKTFPSSFTVFAASIVEYWGDSINSPLFRLLDSKNKTWLYVELTTFETYTEYTIHFSGVDFTVKFPSHLFPKHWTRVSFSFNSNTSMATLVADGKQIDKRLIVVDRKPSNLNMIIGWGYWGGYNRESPGKITDVNIFSTSLTNEKEMTEAGTENCGALGDFVNWEEANWTLHSKAKMIEVDSARR